MGATDTATNTTESKGCCCCGCKLCPYILCQEEIKSTKTMAGKIGVWLFHTYIWLSIALCLVIQIFPSLMPTCVFGEFDEYTTTLLWGFMRTFLTIFIVFLLYIESYGAAKNLFNVEVLSIMMAFVWVLFYVFTRKQLDKIEIEKPYITEECWTMMRQGDGAFCVAPFVILLFLLIDRFLTRDTAPTTSTDAAQLREPLTGTHAE